MTPLELRIKFKVETRIYPVHCGYYEINIREKIKFDRFITRRKGLKTEYGLWLENLLGQTPNKLRNEYFIETSYNSFTYNRDKKDSLNTEYVLWLEEKLKNI